MTRRHRRLSSNLLLPPASATDHKQKLLSRRSTFSAIDGQSPGEEFRPDLVPYHPECWGRGESLIMIAHFGKLISNGEPRSTGGRSAARQADAPRCASASFAFAYRLFGSSICWTAAQSERSNA